MLRLTTKPVGSIQLLGTSYVLGFARHITGDDQDADLIYLNIAGPPTSIEGVWANLIEHRNVVVRGDEIGSFFLRHGGWSGLGKLSPYERFQQRMPSIEWDNLILVDKRVAEPVYSERTSTFVFAGPDMLTIIGQHVRNLVNIAVFPEWFPMLEALGRKERLLMPIHSFGHKVYHLNLDQSRWTTVISLAIRNGDLPFPDTNGKITLKPVVMQSASSTQPNLDNLGIILSDAYYRAGWRLEFVTDDTIRAVNTDTNNSTGNYSVGTTQKEIEQVRSNLMRSIKQIMSRKSTTLPSTPQPNSSSSNNSNPITCTLTFEREWTWAKFSRKPSSEVIDILKDFNFRWGRRRKAWYTRRHVSNDSLDAIRQTLEPEITVIIQKASDDGTG